MYVRFYIDRETGYPHIFSHGVEESEIEDVLVSPGEDRGPDEGAHALP